MYIIAKRIKDDYLFINEYFDDTCIVSEAKRFKDKNTALKHVKRLSTDDVDFVVVSNFNEAIQAFNFLDRRKKIKKHLDYEIISV